MGRLASGGRRSAGPGRGAYLYAKRQPPTYKTNGRVFLNADVLGQPGQDTVRLVSTQADLASSTPVLTRMSKALGIPVAAAEERLTVIPAEEGIYFTITGTGGTAAAAVELVMAAERSYEGVVSGQQQKDRQAVLDGLVEARISLEREYDRARSLRDELTGPRLVVHSL